MIEFKRIEPEAVRWDELDAFADRTVFQSREWLNFISETQNAKPVIAELRDGGDVVGYFTGLVVKRMGVRILGSSFPGWATPFMGFNLLPGVARRPALERLEKFAFDDLRCLHFEISDRYLTLEDGEGLGLEHKFYTSFETDLKKTEEELFKAMNSACRRCIRKAEKSGVSVEEAHDREFADEYYEQLKDVFAKQGLVPTYDAARVRALINHLLPTGNVLLLRVRGPEGNCIGTGIYPALNKIAEFWGNASFRASQNFRPNEICHWYAMRYWKARGVEFFDWGGGGSYKVKYGPYKIDVPWFYKSKYKVLSTLRHTAQRAFAAKQKLQGRFLRTPAPSQDSDEE